MKIMYDNVFMKLENSSQMINVTFHKTRKCLIFTLIRN